MTLVAITEEVFVGWALSSFKICSQSAVYRANIPKHLVFSETLHKIGNKVGQTAVRGKRR